MRRFAARLCALLALGPLGAQALPALPSFPGLGGLQLPSYPAPPQVPALPVPPPGPLVGPPAPAGDAPDYRHVTALFSALDTRLDQLARGGTPFLNVLDVTAFRTWAQHRGGCQGKRLKGEQVDPQTCPRFEWPLPFSTLTDAQAVGQDLRAAWQRFEDRSFWRVQLQLNRLSLYPLTCLVNWQTGLGTQTPDLISHVPPGTVPDQMAQALPSGVADNALHLESYGLIPHATFPQVSNADFCDGLGLLDEPPDFMFLPGGCTYVFGVKTVCLHGGSASSGPGESPLWFNGGEAERRVQAALRHVADTYYPQYQQDVVRALSPGRHAFFFPLPWHLPWDGAVIAAVMNSSADPGQFQQLAQQAHDRLGGLEGDNASAYYFQSNALRPQSLDLHLLPGRKDALVTPPGLWKLEEFKRTLQASSLPYYERLGYASFFEAWEQLDTLALPEPDSAKPLRQISFLAPAVDTYIGPGVRSVPNPTWVNVAPYLVPFTGLRAHFDLASVPEGYALPRVRGTPLYDYGRVLR